MVVIVAHISYFMKVAMLYWLSTQTSKGMEVDEENGMAYK